MTCTEEYKEHIEYVEQNPGMCQSRPDGRGSRCREADRHLRSRAERQMCIRDSRNTTGDFRAVLWPLFP